MKKRRKWIFNMVFLVLVLAATLYYVFRGQDLSQVLGYLRMADARWWAFGFLLVIASISCEGTILCLLIRSMGLHARLWHCILYSFSGFFFCCVTPSATGGQPIQVYLMSKDGVPPLLSVPLLLIIIITYKLVLIVLGLAIFLFRPATIWMCLSPVIGWFWLGLGLNIAVVVLYSLLIFCPALIERLLRFVLRIGKRWISQEKADAYYEKLEKGMQRYRSVAQWIKSHPLAMVRILAITFFQRFLLFGVTYLAFRSFGLSGTGPGTVMGLQGMICLASDMMPMPGGTGLNEILFLKLFTPLSGENLTLPLMILSRGIGFYGQILLGGLMSIVAFLVIGKKKPVRR